MAVQLTSAWLTDNGEEQKAMLYTSDGRLIGIREIKTININQHRLIGKNKEDIEIKHLESDVCIGSDEKLYELEKVHTDLYIVREIAKDNYADYLHLII